MSSGRRRVTICEVGPRDGLQNERDAIATHHKVELIDRLASVGLRVIEATSFVSPRAVPQLADGAQVLAAIRRLPDVAYPVLVPNVRGYEAARDAGADHVAVFTAASESFARRNINATIAESIERFVPVIQAARRDGVHVRGYVSTAWGCPFEGAVSPAAVHDVARRLLDAGVDTLSIGDTIGVAVPAEVEPVCGPLLDLVGDPGRLGLHFHDTRGTALANAWAGLELGVTTFDSSVGGLGGCPFAPGATGNLATEDLVWMLERSGVDTGVDLPALVEVARWAAQLVGRSPAGHVANATLWTGEPLASRDA